MGRYSVNTGSKSNVFIVNEKFMWTLNLDKKNLNSQCSNVADLYAHFQA